MAAGRLPRVPSRLSRRNDISARERGQTARPSSPIATNPPALAIQRLHSPPGFVHFLDGEGETDVMTGEIRHDTGSGPSSSAGARPVPGAGQPGDA